MTINPDDFILDPFASAIEYQMHKYRVQLYRCFQSCISKPAKVDDEEERRVFDEFKYALVQDYQVSYGLLSFGVHAYLVTLFWSRIGFCPGIESYGWINGWSVWIQHLNNCPTRPSSFVDFAGWNQAAFYTISLTLHFFKPSWEAYCVWIGTFWINGLVSMAYWTMPSSGWVLSGSGPSMYSPNASPTSFQYDTFYGRWNAVYIPCLFWCLFLVLKRNFMSIVMWENKVRLFQPVPNTIGVQDDVEKDTRARPNSWTRFIYRLWQLFCPLIGLYLWKWTLSPNLLESADLNPFPSFWYVLVVSLSSSCTLLVWFSYLSFQQQCLLWFEPYRHGILINEFDTELRLGIIY